MITYTTSTVGLRPDQLQGFFEGWPQPPSPEAHVRLLQHAANVVLAHDESSGEVVGFITAISDGIWTAYIPLLEVKPAWRGQGIGRALLQQMLCQFHDYYMVDVLCDAEVQGFFTQQGFFPASGACLRAYQHQAALATMS
jgi:ribosomal protein S18 acetylase RimI-like enzyme